MEKSDSYTDDSHSHWHFPQVQLHYPDSANFSADALINDDNIRNSSFVASEFHQASSASGNDLLMQHTQQSLLRLQPAQLQGVVDVTQAAATSAQNNDTQASTLNILTEQLQQLAQAGFSFTIYDGNNSHIIHNGQIDLSGAVATESDAASALLQHQPTPQLQDAQQKPEHDVRLTSVAEEGSAVTAHVGQGDMTNLKVNLPATVHGSPLAFSIDGKHYVLTDSGDYSLLDNGKETDIVGTTAAEATTVVELQTQQNAALHMTSQQHETLQSGSSPLPPPPSHPLTSQSCHSFRNAEDVVAHTSTESPMDHVTSVLRATTDELCSSQHTNAVQKRDDVIPRDLSELRKQLPDAQALFESSVRDYNSALPFSQKKPERRTYAVKTESNAEVVTNRKSKRLAKQEQVVVPKEPPKYTAEQVYSVQELWCDDCKKTYVDGCPDHGTLAVNDRVVLTRAWASLPTGLAISKCADAANDDRGAIESVMGVFAKKPLSRNMQFGPFVAELVDSREELQKDDFVLQVETGDVTQYVKATDEDLCNWMMFVRPAQNYSEQNLVAYQHGQAIYFVTCKEILPKEELKVWYAAHYAHRWNITLHPVPPTVSTDTSAIGKFECIECEKTFKTASRLQQHLDANECGENRISSEENVQLPTNLNGIVSNEVENVASQQDGSTFQSWKKRKRNMYFSKIKKYKEISKRAEQKRELREKVLTSDVTTDAVDDVMEVQDTSSPSSSTPVFRCSQCDSVFDSASLLNIHAMTHSEDAVELADDVTSQNSEQATAAIAAPSLTGSDRLKVKCPCCAKQFACMADLIKHTPTHRKPRRKIKQIIFKRQSDPNRPFPCNLCNKSFNTELEFTNHQVCHAQDGTRRPVTCDVCCKRFMTNSALAVHMKMHSAEKYFTCPICRQGYDMMVELRQHVEVHRANGVFPCSHCHKSFPDLASIKKHVRISHPYQHLPCPVCHKIFPRTDKLRLHMRSHSDHKAFMCEECGRQFKRKDKLKEHIKRMHDPANPRRLRNCVTLPSDELPKPKFVPRVAPTEIHRFIYKCHQCLLGFKRRGMLVNHLAKRHPSVKPDSIPELNLPILRTQRSYFCQYCERSYRSSTKRKEHILKNHPGATLPLSQRMANRINNPENNSTYSQFVGSVTANPFRCEYCHKQYASKAKLTQHQRKDHPDRVQHRKLGRYSVHQSQEPTAQVTYEIPQDVSVVKVQQGSEDSKSSQGHDNSAQPQGDLLTQAMSELTQSLEYRPQQPHQQQTEFQITLPLQAPPGDDHLSEQAGGQPIVVAPGDVSQGTLDILQQALMHGGFTATLITDPAALVQAVHHQQSDQQTAHDFSQHNIHTTAKTEQDLAQTEQMTQNDVTTTADGIVVQNMHDTQTITVPLSIASQLISKSWGHAAENG